MKKLLCLCLFLGILCIELQAQTATTLPLIPKPLKTQIKKGIFTVNSRTQIYLASSNEQLKLSSDYLWQLFNNAAGFPLGYIDKKPSSNYIVFVLDPKIIGDEAYKLTITPQSIEVRAKTPAGAFFAVQTIRQLLPAEIESNGTSNTKWTVPAIVIEDAPRFGYRGAMLDVSRHFFSVDFVKRFIDMMVLYKMNTFHWHLVDDQGWRIEIKKYPLLTEFGSYRAQTAVGRVHTGSKVTELKFDCEPYKGYYTQDEIREVIKYAADRFITIIPEIEMPGHAVAALCAYPKLGCIGGPYYTSPVWGVHNDVFCTKDETFTFLENVLAEVIDLFPSKYIHIGGDECPKLRWNNCAHCQQMIKEKGLKGEHGLQSYFISRIEKFVNSKGRSIIGWDEILEGGLAPNATVMSWRGLDGGIAAAQQNHNVIMAPTTYCYLDYAQSKDANEPLSIGGYIPVEKVYGFDPVPKELTPDQAKHILGVQANLWTEYIGTPEYVEYMMFPRAIAMSEVQWTPVAAKNYADFLNRLTAQRARLDALKVNYAKHVFGTK